MYQTDLRLSSLCLHHGRSPGASVTLDCSVDHPSAGWSFYWYKAVPKPSHNSYDYELLPGSENGTEQHLFIIDGQTHTAGYVCRAGREDRVYYSGQSEPKFVWSGDLNSAASLTVSPDSVQHFTKTSVSLSCEGNSTEWRVMRFTKSYLYHCSSWGTMTGSTCTITSSWVSGVFWCESETGQFSNAVNITKYVVLIILLLLFLYLYRKSKDSCCIRSQSTNQGPARDHMINQDEIKNMPQYSTLLHGDRCLYETIGGPVEAGNGASNEPEESLYSNVAAEAVLTIEPNWTTFFIGESVTFKCDITGDKDSDWFYSIYWNDQEWKGSTKKSNTIYLNVSDRPKAVLTVSPSWPSPGASVTLDCSVDHPSAGWSFYWYKAVPKPSHNSYDYELLPGSEKGTEQHLFIIDGQTHTAGYVCRAGREDRVYYSGQSEPKFVWSGDLNSAASLTVSPDSVQHFTKTSVSLSCEGNSTEWRVMRFTKSDNLYRCFSWGTMTGSTCTITSSWVIGVFWCESETGQFSNAVNITKYYYEMILVSPVRPVAEGRSVTLSCKFKTGTVLYNVDFYKDDKLIQNDTRKELTISAVSKSDEGFYKCKRREPADGWTSPESWFSVKSASGPGKASQFPILLIVGLLGAVVLIFLLLLFLYLYRKSKDSCCIRSQRTNQSPARDHMINQDETNQRENASVLQDNACLYETIKGPEEPANDESRDVTYSVVELKNISKKGKRNEPEDCVYSHVKMTSAAGMKKYYLL
ncbi:hypothetical protein JOQ06_024312 [Pogonophryne albipinna]|uniref:Ig-like domain-containing protein n=1 Tax=Pogonophryne albipinna TaxID=1090488 RepID=A0AAD6BP74_9TELE|nr:hypothetical protein JOQ06_024312 [Pogonophryne albipinna]